MIPVSFVVFFAVIIGGVLMILIMNNLLLRDKNKELHENIVANDKYYRNTLDADGKTFQQLAYLAPKLYKILGLGYSRKFGYAMYKAWDANLIAKVWESSDKDDYRKLAKKLREGKF